MNTQASTLKGHTVPSEQPGLEFEELLQRVSKLLKLPLCQFSHLFNRDDKSPHLLLELQQRSNMSTYGKALTTFISECLLCARQRQVYRRMVI
jgi:hypothetical protein